MAAPVANFSFIQNPSNPLEITFQGLPSSNGEPITGWAWNFGDGSPVETTQVATHTYSVAGVYLVQLVVQNTDGTDTAVNYITITNTPNIMASIIAMVECKVPPDFMDYPCAYNYIRKWQLYLQPQVNPTPIPDSDVFIETSWPPLFNVLIAELTVYDIIIERANQFMIAGNVASSQTGGSTGSNNTVTAGGLKKLETGPSNAEWYENKFLDLGNQSEFARVVYEYGKGMIEQYKQIICVLAHRLLVKLDICEYTRNNNRIFKKASIRNNCPTPSFFRPWT